MYAKTSGAAALGTMAWHAFGHEKNLVTVMVTRFLVGGDTRI